MNDSIRVAEVGTSRGFEAGEPRVLFRVGSLRDCSGFDVLPGDPRLALYPASRTERERVVVVANFLEELRALKPVALGRGNP